jgi:hypothetical protein
MAIEAAKRNPDLQVYDYTKSVDHALAFAAGKLPANLDITFSRTESNDTDCRKVLMAGGRVAVVFRDGSFPRTWQGFPVVDGDDTDLRFLDPRGVVVALKAKGPAIKDRTGWVVDTNLELPLLERAPELASEAA